jgi:uncharacterized membrane protein HdeD (DUF308 family)
MAMNVLARNWGWVALRGVAALIFGALTLANPAISLVTLILLYGAYAVADGIFTIISALANRRGETHWVALILAGILSVAAGVVAFLLPGMTALFLLYWIAIWAIVTGAAQIMAAIRLRKVLSGEWLLVLAGALSIVFGILLFTRPGAGALAVVLWIGAYAVVVGIVLIAFAFRLRSWKGEASMRVA